jgi:isopenicillin-N epimerase
MPGTANPLWGDDWPAVRDLWLLDPEITFLNHGSFGATPRPVLDRQMALRTEMERRPVEFLWRRLPDLLREARGAVAAFLMADPEGLAFVPNATTAVATVLAQAGLEPGDEVLLTDHAYPAVLKAARRECARTGAELVLASVPLPLPPPGEITRIVAGALTGRTKLAIVEHVTSATAAIFPIAEIVAACRARGVPALVDAAHGPGMLPIDLAALAPDYWTGNLHKWVCAPKGAAVLFVAPEHRPLVGPLVASHGYGGTFHEQFDWTGTADPTAFLSVPAALELFRGLGWERVRRHNHELAAYGRRVVAAAVRTEPPVPEAAFGSMALIALPAGAATTEEEAAALQGRLYREDRIEVPLGMWDGRAFVRISAQAYNCRADVERLASALPRLL